MIQLFGSQGFLAVVCEGRRREGCSVFFFLFGKGSDVGTGCQINAVDMFCLLMRSASLGWDA